MERWTVATNTQDIVRVKRLLIRKIGPNGRPHLQEVSLISLAQSGTDYDCSCGIQPIWIIAWKRNPHGNAGGQAVSIIGKAYSEPQWQTRHHTCAQLFVDVMTAFYSSIRELVMKTTLDRHGIAQLVLKAGLPPSAVVELEQRLRDLPSLHTQGLDGHDLAMLEEASGDAWFLLPGAARLAL
eukprot:6902393-Pyramimonas_sp.AAC.2